MPFRSERQRRYLHIHAPKVAKRWEARYGKRIARKRKPRTAKRID